MSLGLLPQPRLQAFYNGIFSPGAKANFYLAGTTTRADTYSNTDGEFVHKNLNPVVAGSDGLFGPIFLLPQAYKIVLTNAAGSIIYTQDDIAGSEVNPPFIVNEYLKAPNLYQYGGVGNGIADDTDAVVDAQAADVGPIFVPFGEFKTTLDYLDDLTGTFWGNGSIIDGDGYPRGKWYTNQSEGISARGNTSDHRFWYEGDWSRCSLPIEKVITAPPVTTGSLVTNAGTASGAILHFSSVPSWVGVSAGNGFALVVRGTNINAAAQVLSVTPTTVTMTHNVTGAVASAATITFGLGQYLQPFEVTPVNVALFAAQDTISHNQDVTLGGGAVVFGYNLVAENDSGGGGLGGYHAQINVSRAYAGYSPAAPYNTASAFLFGGLVHANCEDAYLTAIEVSAVDNGHQAHTNLIVLDASRTDPGSSAADFWNGIKFNFGACTESMTSWFCGGGPSNSGADYTGGDFSSNFNAAQIMAANQRLFLNGTPGAAGNASAVGGEFLEYNSSAQKIIIGLGSANDFQFAHNSGNPIMYINGSGGVAIDSELIITTRYGGWSPMTGTPNIAAVYDTASVTLPQLAGRVMAIQAALTAHHALLGA